MTDSLKNRMLVPLAAVLAAGMLGAAPKPRPPGTSVEMPYLIAPMSVDGKLVSYAYISSVVLTSSPDAAVDVRARLPFIQDAFVRDVNNAAIGTGDSLESIDQDALNKRLLADAKRATGGSVVVGIKFTQIQVVPARTGH